VSQPTVVWVVTAAGHDGSLSTVCIHYLQENNKHKTVLVGATFP